jgi:hypothetical protein
MADQVAAINVAPARGETDRELAILVAGEIVFGIGARKAADAPADHDDPIKPGSWRGDRMQPSA